MKPYNMYSDEHFTSASEKYSVSQKPPEINEEDFKEEQESFYLPFPKPNRRVASSTDSGPILSLFQWDPAASADIIKVAMVNLHREMKHRKMRSRMIMQVHDELVFEAPAEEADRATEIIRTAMEHAMELNVPLKVEIGTGKNWLEAH